MNENVEIPTSQKYIFCAASVVLTHICMYYDTFVFQSRSAPPRQDTRYEKTFEEKFEEIMR